MKFLSCADYLSPDLPVPGGSLPLDPLSACRPEPQPAEGCRRCAALADGRDRAKRMRDWSIVTDFNILLRAHPHPGEPG
ncbi:hypothetical protein RM844_16810 [Streptomyces sp. DSM 44915]|uniref:Uncharacterized protein n=1 Tax=Streptomyces chisholmiae TaxID=3075540 RepID=A0ABU2JT85_9ACTN|nr:hypothetical protein [Streptomyces sp. DSM 44915]MDT0267943.1 hypothetical protein [Streptomyces sp. DSM 44915]